MKWPVATALLLAAPAGMAEAAPGRCVPGPAEPALPGIRATPVMICDYGAAGLHAGLVRLMAIPRGGHDIAAIERSFGLPQIETIHDDAGSATWHILLRSAPGRTSWSVLIVVAERFVDRRAHFRGTRRPVRIDPRSRGDANVTVNLLGREAAFRPGQPTCLPGATIARAAAASGWRPSLMIRMVMDAPPPAGLVLVRGPLSATVDYAARDADCVRSFYISSPAFRMGSRSGRRG